MTFFLAKEYQNGSCKMYHISDGEAEDVEGEGVCRLVSQAQSLCVNFEVDSW